MIAQCQAGISLTAVPVVHGASFVSGVCAAGVRLSAIPWGTILAKCENGIALTAQVPEIYRATCRSGVGLSTNIIIRFPSLVGASCALGVDLTTIPWGAPLGVAVCQAGISLVAIPTPRETSTLGVLGNLLIEVLVP